MEKKIVDSHIRLEGKKDNYRPFAPTQQLGETIYLLGMKTELVKHDGVYMLKGGKDDVIMVEKTTVCHEGVTRPKDNPTGLTSVGRRARIKGVLVDNQYPYAMHGLNGFCHALWRPNELISNLQVTHPQHEKESLDDYNQRITDLMTERGFVQLYIELELGLNMLQHRLTTLEHQDVVAYADNIHSLRTNISNIIALCSEKYPELEIQRKQLIEGGAEFFHLRLNVIPENDSVSDTDEDLL